jgi:hypothetical protein
MRSLWMARNRSRLTVHASCKYPPRAVVSEAVSARGPDPIVSLSA